MATVKKRGKSYLIRVYSGRAANGRQIERTKTWTPPADMTERQADKEAQIQAAQFEAKIRAGEIAERSIKFEDFTNYWFSRYANKNLKPRTLARYRDLLKRINLSIGHLRLENIRPGHLLDFYDYLSEQEYDNMTFCKEIDLKAAIKKNKETKDHFAKRCGVSLTTLSTAFKNKAISQKSAEQIASGLSKSLEEVFRPTGVVKKLSGRTVQHYHRLISDILNFAVEWQFIPYNPADRVTPPKNKPKEIEYLDDVQTKELIHQLKNAPGYYRRAILLLLLTGMRRGELLGLEWQDVDWHEKTIEIRRTSQYLPHKGLFTDTPKTDSSNRIIYLSDQALDILREQFQWQMMKEANKKSGALIGKRVIVSAKGNPMRPDTLTHWFSKFIKETDLPQIHIHSLRHTYATLCIADGNAITAVAAQLGHANVATTTTIYSHAIKSSQIKMTDHIGMKFADVI